MNQFTTLRDVAPVIVQFAPKENRPGVGVLTFRFDTRHSGWTPYVYCELIDFLRFKFHKDNVKELR